MRQAMHNVEAVLAGAGMSIPDIVKLTVFVTLDDSTAVESYRRTRDEILGNQLLPVFWVGDSSRPPGFS